MSGFVSPTPRAFAYTGKVVPCERAYAAVPGDLIKAYGEIAVVRGVQGFEIRNVRTDRENLLFWTPPLEICPTLIGALSSQSLFIGRAKVSAPDQAVAS